MRHSGVPGVVHDNFHDNGGATPGCRIMMELYGTTISDDLLLAAQVRCWARFESFPPVFSATLCVL